MKIKRIELEIIRFIGNEKCGNCKVEKAKQKVIMVDNPYYNLNMEGEYYFCDICVEVMIETFNEIQ